MSNKIASNRASYIKNWTAAIAGSLFLLSQQDAQAGDQNRMRFRDFRDQNPGIDRRALRDMFKTNVRGSNPEQFSICPVTVKPDQGRHNGTAVALPRDLTGLRKVEHNRIANQSLQLSSSGSTVRLSSGIDLDLTSASNNITLGEKLLEGVGAVEIMVDGTKKALVAGAQVTAAEYIAVKQVLSGGGQTILLGRDGSAKGGSVDLSSITLNNDVMKASHLVIPANVTTRGDFSKGSDFRLNGDLSNFGTIYTFDADERGRGGTIRAQDILNATGAQITSEVDLALLSSGNLTNLGTITSKGNLSLSAGGSLKNSSTIKADKELSLSAPVVENNGALTSLNGNVNLDGPSGAALFVNNTGGKIAALNGAINVRNADYAGAFDTTITGGDLFSKEMNLNAGQATLNLNVGKLTGTINETGFASHIFASTAVLSLGHICLTGDPLYVNDAGAITFGSNLQVAENLTAIARDDITIANGAIIAANSGTQGYNITMIAGANITSTAGGATLDGTASANGGSINLGTGSYIYTSPIAGPGDLNAGDISLYAFEGSSAGSGRVDLSAGYVNADSINAGRPGTLTIVAGGANLAASPAVRLGSISAAPGSSYSGPGSNVYVSTAQPTSTGGDITYDTAGNLAPGATLISDGNINNDASVSINSYIAVRNDVDIRAGDYIRSTPSGSIIANYVNLSAGSNGVGEETSSILVEAASSSPVHIRATATGGDVWVTCVSTSAPLVLESSTGNHDYTVNSLYVPTTLGGPIDGTGTFTLTTGNSIPSTPALDMNNKSISFHDILVQSPAGANLYVYGGGVWGTFNSSAAGTTTFISPDRTIKLSGLKFTGGDAVMTAHEINVDGDTKGNFTNNLILNTCNYTGTGVTPDWLSIQLNCDAATIANSSGDVSLPSNLVFHGKDLAILAYGNVNTTGATLIDLSNATGVGGNLTIMAGYSFTPSTSGQQQSKAEFTITGVNPDGGNIDLASVDIVTTGATGFASGSVVAVATTGTTLGSVSLGNIDTSGDTGGNVKIISPGNITVGNINTTGSPLSGNVVLAAATAVVSGGPVKVEDGLVSNGTFEVGTRGSGDILIKNIDAPAATVTIVGALTNEDDVRQVAGSTLDAYRLVANINNGYVFLGNNLSSTSLDRLQVSSTGTGLFRIYNQVDDLEIEAVSAPNLAFQVIADGMLYISENLTADSVSLISNNANINLYSDLTLSGRTVQLSAHDQITSTPTGLINATESLSLASQLHLRSSDLSGGFGGGFQRLSLHCENGNIGTDASNRFVVNQDGPLEITASTGNGNIFLHTDNTDKVTIGQVLTNLGGGFDYTNGIGNGPVEIEVIDTVADISINVNGNALNIAPNALIRTRMAGSGNILIANNGANKKTDFFNIGNGATIETNAASAGLGNVTLTMGPVPVPVLQKKTFSKKTITYTESGGGLVYWGKKKWEAKTGPITITAKGANVTFSNAFAKKNAVIGSNVTITADPPVAETAALLSTPRLEGKVIPDILTTSGSPPEDAGDFAPVKTNQLKNAFAAGKLMLSGQINNLATVYEAQIARQERTLSDDSSIKPAAPSQFEVDADVYCDFALASQSEKTGGVRRCSADMKFTNGSALFVPSNDTVIETPRGKIKIGAGAVAYVVVSDQHLGVYDLNDWHRGAVKIEALGKSFTLSPGRHLLIGQGGTAHTYADVNPVECLMHRNIEKHELADGNWSFTSEFSVPNAVQALKPLRLIMHSNDVRERAVADRMMKTAAVLTHLSGAVGQFEFHPRARQLASR